MQSLRKWMKRVCFNAVLSEITVHLAAEAFITSHSFWLGIGLVLIVVKIFSPSVYHTLIERDAYYDFLINVNIICKDILLYIFVKCFLKANFNNKKDVHIWHVCITVFESSRSTDWKLLISSSFWSDVDWLFRVQYKSVNVNVSLVPQIRFGLSQD